MKRYEHLPLKVFLTVVLIFSAVRLASIGAGLLHDRARFEELKRVQGESVGADESAETKPLPVIFVETKEPESAVSKAAEASAEATDTSAKTADTLAKAAADSFPAEEEKEDAAGVNAARFFALTEKNSDFFGWLKIEGTAVDYPVMYSPEEPDFYLSHDFDGKDSHSGVPYLGENCGLPCDNAIIFAHNMKNGSMFSDLLKYADESFYREHPVIRFDTVREDGIYDIIAVFREKVHYQEETGVFRYYNYGGDLTEAQFREYVEKIRALSLYDTGVTAEYGQQLLTLSTCAYHTENGRFVVVAAKRMPECVSGDGSV